MSILDKKHFQTEAAAFSYLEKTLWADGVVCPHCGTVDRAGKLDGVKDKKGRNRLGLWKCYDCRKQFTVKVGTVFESAHIPLHKMLQAVYLMCASKKGISAHQLHRTLEVTYKSAWFLAHRIREAMRPKEFTPMGGAGKIVEIDETSWGKQEGVKGKLHVGSYTFRNIVLTLVERHGSARSFHVAGNTVGTLIPIIRANVNHETALMTDDARWYENMNKDGHWPSHDTVTHTKHEYARGEITTNTVEGYYSIFKRGMRGVYQHCAEKHLHRYLSEFDFRYSHRIALGVDDQTRATKVLHGIVGKRLTYQNPHSESAEI